MRILLSCIIAVLLSTTVFAYSQYQYATPSYLNPLPYSYSKASPYTTPYYGMHYGGAYRRYNVDGYRLTSSSPGYPPTYRYVDTSGFKGHYSAYRGNYYKYTREPTYAQPYKEGPYRYIDTSVVHRE
jgi:hypothetical protein